jgi:hypothetical protein
MGGPARSGVGSRWSRRCNRPFDIVPWQARVCPPRRIMANVSEFSIVTYLRKPGHWRAAITPIRRSGTVTHSKTITSIVTPDDFESDPDAQFAAEKTIRKL